MAVERQPQNTENQWPVGSIRVEVPGALPKKDEHGNHTHNILSDSKVTTAFVSGIERMKGFGNPVDVVASGKREVFIEVTSGAVLFFVAPKAFEMAKRAHWHDAKHFLETALEAGSPTVKAVKSIKRKIKNLAHHEDPEVKRSEFTPQQNGNRDHLH